MGVRIGGATRGYVDAAVAASFADVISTALGVPFAEGLVTMTAVQMGAGFAWTPRYPNGVITGTSLGGGDTDIHGMVTGDEYTAGQTATVQVRNAPDSGGNNHAAVAMLRESATGKILSVSCDVSTGNFILGRRLTATSPEVVIATIPIISASVNLNFLINFVRNGANWDVAANGAFIGSVANAVAFTATADQYGAGLINYEGAAGVDHIVDSIALWPF